MAGWINHPLPYASNQKPRSPTTRSCAQIQPSQTYYIRVAAIGDVDAQQVNPTGDPPDNTNWSGVIEAVPADQPPSSPGPVTLYVLDGSTLQVITFEGLRVKFSRTDCVNHVYTPFCEGLYLTLNDI